MKKLIITLALGSSMMLLSCGDKTTESDQNQEQETDTSAETEADSEEQGLILKEDAFGPVVLPFWQNGTKQELEGLLSDCTISEENAVAEGGEFKVYHVGMNGSNVADFEMSMDDSTYLYQLVLRTSDISDQFGLKVGDSYGSIKENRPDAPIAKMGYHFSTYVKVPGSNISYELQGDYTPPEGLSLENVQDHQYTEEDLANFKITSIIWANPTPQE